MATASFNMQSVFAAPSGGLSSRNIRNTNQLFFKRNAPVGVRCMAQGDPIKEDPSVPSTSTSAAQPQMPPSPPPVSKPKVSTKFRDLLAFSGPAPERINGRLAMVGFVAAIALELSKGENVFAQISDGGVGWFLGTTALLTVASMVPLFKGIRAEAKSKGLMTSDAELWNGRFAMLGLVALAFTEYVAGGTLV
ncbi:PREDICTED: early light-induced protein 2, chloroplastic-like [Camelina sativa]|uniref:Early light-induced protein 2, chloroplastic-like n=1 Tax=Camelina sativa TaxID=90675 RepID=A0ABM0UFJ6_CAMSA|nr:PREDICTED: early light-induced protein 2, chloroplastic-like [Camelina sativa]